MIAGRLEIELMANVARLSSDMAQAKGMVSNAMQSIERAVAGATRAFAMLGVGIGVASFASLVKSAINAGDELNKLSQKTGIAIAELSALKHVADLSGVSTESLAKGMKKLSEQMVEANDGTSKQARLFKTLGIDINTGPTVALEKLATQFAGMRDGAVKTALATQLFGKAGQDLIPLLNQGADGVKKLKEEAQRLGLVWTEEAAKAAEQFNDNVRAIQKSSEGLATDLVNQMGPSLVAITNAMKEAAISGGVLKAVWVGLGGALAELLGIGGTSAATSRIRDIEKEIIRLSDDVIPALRQEVQLAQAKGAPSKGWEIALRNTETQIRALQLAIRAVNGEFDDQVARMARQGRGRPAGGASESAIRDALAQDEAASKKAHEERMRRAQAEIDAEEMFAKDYFEAWDAVYKQRTAEALAEAKIRMDAAAAEAKGEAMFAKDMQEAWEAYNQFLKKQGEERQAQLQQHAQTWSDMATAAGDFFADLVMNGKSAFDNLKRWVKELLAQMIALFAKRWILNLAAGGSVLGAAGSALGATSDGSMAGNVLSTGASLLGAGSSLGIGGAGVGASMWGAMGAGTAVTETGVVLATGSMAGTAVGSGVMGGVYTALANIPVWGWIAMAVIAAIAFFTGRGGGPKVGGFFSSGGSTDRLFTPSQGDSQVRDIVLATVATYDSLVGRMGGTSRSGLDFRLGFDHDPAGDAMSRVSAQLRGPNGEALYSNLDRQMDDKEVPAAIALETKRLLLAALQATDFHDEIDAIFDSATDIANMTGEAIDAVIAQAREMFNVIQGLEGLGLRNFDVAALRTFAGEGETIGQTFERVAGAWMGLVDSFTSDEVKLENARRALEESGIALPATTDGWLDMMRALDMSTESGREAFATMMNLSGAFDLVTNRAAAMRAEWDDLQGVLARYNGGTDLSIAVGRFQAGNAWARGMSPEQLIAQLRTITAEDFGNYSEANRALINAILGLGLNIQGLNQTVSFVGVTSGPDDPSITPEMREWLRGAPGRQARSGLGSFLRGLQSNEEFSPLPFWERFGLLQQDFVGMVGRANAGDVDAIGGLPQIIQQMLTMGRQGHGSTSNYVDFFNWVQSMAGGVAGAGKSPAAFQLDEQKTTNAHLLDVRALLQRIADSADGNAEVVALAAMEAGDAVRVAVKKADLKGKRR